MADDRRGGFLTTLPGVLTGIAALITAVAGLWIALHQTASSPKAGAASPVAPPEVILATPAPAPATMLEPASRPVLPPNVGTRVNLLSVGNGAEIAAASSDEWFKVSDGDTASNALLSGEIVYALRGGKGATFDTFGIFVPGSISYNVEQYELSNSDTSETGPFTPIGTFAVKNIKLYKSPYQEVHFSQVTARYFRFRIVKPTNGAVIYGLKLL